MKRAATTLLRNGVPAITQVPASFGDVALQAKSALQQTWETRNEEHQVISPGSLYDSSSPVSTTVTTTTTTTTTPQYEFSNTNDASGITQRIDAVFDNLSVDTTHPTSALLVQTVQDTARDPTVVNKIMGLDSFQKLVSSLPPSFNRFPVGSRRPSSGLEIDTYAQMPTFSSMATQTEDTDFLMDSLERITAQIAPDLGILPPTSPFAVLSPANSTTTTTTSTVPSTTSPASSTSTSNVSSSSSSSSSSSFEYASTYSDPSDSGYAYAEPTEGNGGVPGQTSNVDRVMLVVIPLAILAVAAAVTKLPLRGAADLLQTGFKFVMRMLVKQPV